MSALVDGLFYIYFFMLSHGVNVSVRSTLIVVHILINLVNHINSFNQLIKVRTLAYVSRNTCTRLYWSCFTSRHTTHTITYSTHYSNIETHTLCVSSTAYRTIHKRSYRKYITTICCILLSCNMSCKSTGTKSSLKCFLISLYQLQRVQMSHEQWPYLHNMGTV